MWVQGTWETEEDVLTDLLLLAEYSTPSSSEDLVPDTILNYRKQMAANQQRPLNSDIDESASYIVSGRGRGIRDRVLRPGARVDCHPSDETELKKQIRQVAGMGYSNELIEQSIKAKGYDARDSPSNDDAFKLVPTTSSDSSSSRSSSETAPTRRRKVKD